jgi:hypothetical protein
MIKKLGKSKRNIMGSIRKHNDLLVHSQLQWRYEQGHKWSTKSRQSSFQQKTPVPERLYNVEPQGGLRKAQVKQSVFEYLQNAWGATDRYFREFRDQYNVTYLRNCRRAQREPVPFNAWRVDINTPEQKRFVLIC